jgi:hypothetical protein
MLPAEVLTYLAGRLAHLLPPRPPGVGGNPPLALEVAWTPSPRSCWMDCPTGGPVGWSGSPSSAFKQPAAETDIGAAAALSGGFVGPWWQGRGQPRIERNRQ